MTLSHKIPRAAVLAHLLVAAAALLAWHPAQALDDKDLPETLRRGYVAPVTGPYDNAGYAHGQLGIVRTSYGRASLYVAYRVMQLPPGALATESHARQGDFVNGRWPERPADASDEIAAWLGAREQVQPQAPAARPDYFQRGKMTLDAGPGRPAFEVDTVKGNCGPDAFQLATRTLQGLTADAGVNPAQRQAWVAGQDAVFARCAWTPGKAPLPALPPLLAETAPARLKALRAYQHAAAQFYGGDFESARTEFDAIVAVPDHPMRAWAALGALRSVVRGATIDPAWDAAWQDAYQRRRLRGAALTAALADESARRRNVVAATLKDVEARVAAIQADPGLASMKGAALYTARRAYAQLSPANIANFLMGVLDDPRKNPYSMDFLASWNEYYRRSAPDRPQGPLRDKLRQHPFFDWTLAVQACSDEHGAVDAASCDAEHVQALARWNDKKGNDWLLAALMTARQPGAADVSAAEAARLVPRERPEWASLQFYAARVLRVQGHADEAREMLAQVAQSPALPRADRALVATESR